MIDRNIELAFWMVVFMMMLSVGVSVAYFLLGRLLDRLPRFPWNT